MGLELLVITLVVTGWMTKAVQDGRTDRAYAKKGQVSPRHQVRLARLEKAGRPVSPRGRGPLRNLAAEYWADAMLDLADRHRAKRAHRGPVGYDPDKPSVAQRFDTAVLDGIRRVQASRGWDMTKAAAKTAGRRFVGPVGEKPAADDGPYFGDDPKDLEGLKCWWCQDARVVDGRPCSECQPQPLRYYDSSLPTKTKVGTREDDLEWTGQVWAPVCPRCDKPMGGRDARSGLICDGCGLRAADRHNPPDEQREDDNAGYYDPAHLSGDADEDMLVRTAGCPYLVPASYRSGLNEPAHLCAETRSPNEGDHPYCTEHAARIRDDRGRGGYVAPTGDVDEHLPLESINSTLTPTPTTGGTVMTEASNFETAVPALGDLAAACQNLSDHVAGAEAAADTFQAHVEEIDSAKQDVTAAIGSVQEQLAAKGVSGAAMDSITAAMEQVQAGDLMSAIDLIGQAKAQITDAKVAATEAAGAAGQAQQDLIGQFGDAHNTIASDLGGDASFLDSGGGTGSGAGSGGASGGGPSGAGGGGIWAGDEGVTVSGRAFGSGATTTTGGTSVPPSPRRVGAPSGDRAGGFNGISSTGGGPVNVTGSAMGDNVTVNNG